MQYQSPSYSFKSAKESNISSVELYLSHVTKGVSLRSLARQTGEHPSTILRRIRKVENRRDDPLFDQALDQAVKPSSPPMPQKMRKEQAVSLDHHDQSEKNISKTLKPNAAKRFLRRLSERGTFLALASDMENGVIMRTTADGQTVRVAIIGRAEAQAMALKDWISITKAGRVSKYQITSVGQAALKRMLSEDADKPFGKEAHSSVFAEQHRDWGERNEISESSGKLVRRRVNLAESPLTLLARRKDKEGKPFLSDALVGAGEQLREDFELSRIGPQITQNWDKFLTGRLSPTNSSDFGSGAGGAAKRFRAAMDFLGPGLSEVALRCCCFLEGMETMEKRLGWSARSGKIVLRIALQRLKLHYEREFGAHGPKIG